MHIESGVFFPSLGCVLGPPCFLWIAPPHRRKTAERGELAETVS